jgi:hypothetical protein
MMAFKGFDAFKDCYRSITRFPAKLFRANTLSIELLEAFAFGVTFTWPEWSEILKAQLDDFAMVRCTLVDLVPLGLGAFGNHQRWVQVNPQTSEPGI